jgi:hypothetical protein
MEKNWDYIPFEILVISYCTQKNWNYMYHPLVEKLGSYHREKLVYVVGFMPFSENS